MFLPITFVLFCAAGIVAGAENEYFTAAVFESKHFQAPSAQTKDQIVSANIRVYEKAAEVAAQNGVDIIIFSEYGLFPHNKNRTLLKTFTEHVPDPQKVKANPCNEKDAYEDRPILLTLSCMAQHYGMYIVANMGDNQPCEIQTCDASNVDGCNTEDSCTEGNAYIYNTDVAFDREGNLIARYHKNHLYAEKMNTPNPFEMVTFKTEFGVMGLIICFDIVFKEAAELVEKYDVETLIFPTHWYDDIVPLNAIEWQQGWALGNKVNFLAADGHFPDTGTLGSGIYSKTHGALAYTYSPDGKSRLLIARVPRHDSPVSEEPKRYVISEDEVREEDHEDGLTFPNHCYDQQVGPPKASTDYRCYKPRMSQYALKKLVDPEGTVELCHNEFCCTVTYSADKMDEDYYVAVFNGTNDVRGYFKWAEENCFLVRCDPFGGKLCVSIPSTANTAFNHIEMKASFTESTHVYPTVSTTHNRLAPKSDFVVEREGSQTILKYKSNSGAPLIKAGLFGRCYERDPPFIPFHKF